MAWHVTLRSTALPRRQGGGPRPARRPQPRHRRALPPLVRRRVPRRPPRVRARRAPRAAGADRPRAPRDESGGAARRDQPAARPRRVTAGRGGATQSIVTRFIVYLRNFRARTSERHGWTGRWSWPQLIVCVSAPSTHSHASPCTSRNTTSRGGQLPFNGALAQRPVQRRALGFPLGATTPPAASRSHAFGEGAPHKVARYVAVVLPPARVPVERGHAGQAECLRHLLARCARSGDQH